MSDGPLWLTGGGGGWRELHARYHIVTTLARGERVVLCTAHGDATMDINGTLKERRAAADYCAGRRPAVVTRKKGIAGERPSAVLLDDILREKAND